jgi:hypothetical protein
VRPRDQGWPVWIPELQAKIRALPIAEFRDNFSAHQDIKIIPTNDRPRPVGLNQPARVKALSKMRLRY